MRGCETMTQLDNIIHRIDIIEDGLTLKASYKEEKEDLDQIHSDLSVMRYLGAPLWKVNDAKKRIQQIIQWMDEEEKAAHKE